MAHRTRRLLEQRLGGGVVEVDVEAVGKQELHESERILAAGTLADPPHAAVGVVLHVLALHVPRIGRGLRPHFLRLDIRRDVPVRAERHRLHRVAEYGRDFPFVLLPHHHLH